MWAQGPAGMVMGTPVRSTRHTPLTSPWRHVAVGPQLARILVADDGSAGARGAAAFGDWLTATAGATVERVARAGDADASAAARLYALGLAQALATPLGAALALVHAYDEHVPFTAEPDEALLAACERHAPALLVVGSRGLGAFGRLLLGSTSRRVAASAPCPVVVARSAA